jgi:hypothetical protein
VLNRNVFQSQAGPNPVAVLQPMRVDVASLPAVPVFTETLLLLDLETQESSVDLHKISQLVLGDLGATLQVLRLAGREYGSSQARPHRIVDCISDLGVYPCLEAVSGQTVSRDSRHGAITGTWEHCKEIAQHSEMVADEIPGVNPGEAYLAGLLHSMGSLPAVLGWDEAESSAADAALRGFQMARQWSLPRVVLEFFSEMHLVGCRTKWSEIVRSAHRRAARPCTKCLFEEESRPMLLTSV